MRLQALFDNFAALIGTPYGIAKLRALIQQLAVQGKLVRQDPNDEPALTLLQKVEKERAVSEGKARPRKVRSASVSPDSLPFVIPSEWHWARLGQFTQLIDYGTSERASLDNTGVPIFRMNNIEGGTVLHANLKYVPPYIKDLPRLYLKTNDLLFNRTNSYDLVGKTGIFKGNSDQFTFASYLIRIRLFESFIVPDYVNLAMNADYFRATQINAEVTQQCGQANFNGTKLANTLIPLPPLREQERIVAKTDELTRLCDELEARQQARRESRVQLNNATLAPLNTAASLAPEGFEQAVARVGENFDMLYDSPETVGKLRSTILQLAVQGKLVAQEPGEAPFCATDGNRPDKREAGLLSIPATWRLCPFEELAEIVSGVTKGRRLDGRETAPYPYLRVANVQRGFLDLDVIKEIEIPQKEIEKYRLEADDLLITEGGDWDKVGRTAIWRNEIDNCIHQNHIFRARLKYDSVIPEWVMNYMNSAAGRLYFETASKQTTNLASINMRQLKGCTIPLPPLEEQKRIVAKVNQLMALCDDLEAKLRQAEAEAEKLMSAAVRHVLETAIEAPAGAPISEFANV